MIADEEGADAPSEERRRCDTIDVRDPLFGLLLLLLLEEATASFAVVDAGRGFIRSPVQQRAAGGQG